MSRPTTARTHLAQALRDRGMTIRDLARALRVSYYQAQLLTHGLVRQRSRERWGATIVELLGLPPQMVNEIFEEVGTVNNGQQQKERRRAPDSPAPNFTPRNADRR